MDKSNSSKTSSRYSVVGYWKKAFIPLAFFILSIVLWQLVIASKLIPGYILPSPWGVVKALSSSFPLIADHTVVTLIEALSGLGVAILLSIVFAILMDISPLLKKGMYPLIVISQTVPVISLAPLIALWFGFGILPKALVVALVCFFPMVVNLVEGFDSVDADMRNLFRSMGARRMQIFRFLKMPAALPGFFAGLRISATYSIMGAVIAEWLGGEGGLGVYLVRVKHSYDLERVFAAILVIIVLSMAIFGVVVILQKVLLPWMRVNKDEIIN
ncbi:MAG: ABC transporter permease [Clostridiales bacterium]|nr:ABC transporter permease [Clostridiales bacterium]